MTRELPGPTQQDHPSIIKLPVLFERRSDFRWLTLVMSNLTTDVSVSPVHSCALSLGGNISWSEIILTTMLGCWSRNSWELLIEPLCITRPFVKYNVVSKRTITIIVVTSDSVTKVKSDVCLWWLRWPRRNTTRKFRLWSSMIIQSKIYFKTCSLW